MELLGERPVWSMSGSEKLAALDALEADLARRQTYRLHLIAGLDQDGYAQEIGAHDTTQLLAFRYRLDRPQARRDVRLAQTLPKYRAVSAALPTPYRAADSPDNSPTTRTSPTRRTTRTRRTSRTTRTTRTRRTSRTRRTRRTRRTARVRRRGSCARPRPRRS